MAGNSQDTPFGLWSACLSFFLWGILPIYWKELQHVPALEIMAHRMLWSFVLLLLVLGFKSQLKSTVAALKNKRTLITLLASGILISLSWLVYIWAVNTNQIVAASLGYFLNPICNIILGAILFRDRPTRAQWIAIALAAIGVSVQVVMIGELPWISLALCLIFAFYGLLRKVVAVEAMPGLFIETMMLTPFILIYLAWLWSQGELYFGPAAGAWNNTLLVGGGLVTLLPLLLFAQGVRNLRLTTLGLTQYISPTISLAIGVFMYHEPVGMGQLLSFIFIWAGLIVYTIASLRAQQHLSRVLHADN